MPEQSIEPATILSMQSTSNTEKSTITPEIKNDPKTSLDSKNDNSLGSLNMSAEEIFEFENNLLSQVSDDLLNMTAEDTKEYLQKQKLINMLEEDLMNLEREKNEVFIENRSIISQFKYLQSKKKEIEKKINETKNELIPIDAELYEKEEIIQNIKKEIAQFEEANELK